MKALKYLSLTFGSFAVLAIASGFIIYLSQPSPPAVLDKITGTSWDINSEFHEINSEFWSKQGEKLIFNNESSEMEEVALYSNLLPSEHKKEGYLTSTVTVPQNFDEIDDDAFFGFQLGEKNASKEDCLILGINGKGEVVVQNGNRKPLSVGKVEKESSLLSKVNGSTNLSFHFYQNPTGWIVFFKVKGEESQTGASINHIPVELLDSKDKILSLVTYNPSQKGDIWFKDWKIQNDWTPND